MIESDKAKMNNGKNPEISNPSIHRAVSAIIARLIQQPISPKLIKLKGNVRSLSKLPRIRFARNNTPTTSAAIIGDQI
jgi:hypothetical protein